ncbi:hypothetical protein [Burkholderia sp. BCC1988]|uniref:hypothetical protein n=1 Tax=Burkholderia sp. BCC1988 TaxID=2817443 RepID=UPI002AB24E53|nr:hypothetical protein [Burkholderia sp. BCC1988]
MSHILGQRKVLSSTFCALHNHDKLSIKQRVIAAGSESVSDVFPHGAHLAGAGAPHRDHAQVNLTGMWNVMLLFLSKSAPFRDARAVATCRRRVKTGAWYTERRIRTFPALIRRQSDVISINRVVIRETGTVGRRIP